MDITKKKHQQSDNIHGFAVSSAPLPFTKETNIINSSTQSSTLTTTLVISPRSPPPLVPWMEKSVQSSKPKPSLSGELDSNSKRYESLSHISELTHQFTQQLIAMQDTMGKLTKSVTAFSTGDTHLSALADQFSIAQEAIQQSACSLESSITTRVSHECSTFLTKHSSMHAHTTRDSKSSEQSFHEEVYPFFDKPFIRMIKELRNFYRTTGEHLDGVYNSVSDGRFEESLSRSPEELLSSLSVLLSDPIATHHFRAFALDKRCLQNVDFILDVNVLLATENKVEFVRLAKEINAKYLRSTRDTTSVNIDGYMRAELEKHVESPTAERYRSAYDFVYNLVKRDTFSKFTRSSAARSLTEHWRSSIVPSSYLKRSKPNLNKVVSLSARGEGGLSAGGRFQGSSVSEDYEPTQWCFVEYAGIDRNINILRGVLQSFVPDIEAEILKLQQRMWTQKTYEEVVTVQDVFHECKELLVKGGVPWSAVPGERLGEAARRSTLEGVTADSALEEVKQEVSEQAVLLAHNLHRLNSYLRVYAHDPEHIITTTNSLIAMKKMLKEGKKPISESEISAEDIRIRIESSLDTLEEHLSGPCGSDTILRFARVCKLISSLKGVHSGGQASHDIGSRMVRALGSSGSESNNAIYEYVKCVIAGVRKTVRHRSTPLNLLSFLDRCFSNATQRLPA